jgi:hypothetical protein
MAVRLPWNVGTECVTDLDITLCEMIFFEQRSLETRINLLYSIYPDRKHRFGIEKKWIYRFKIVYFWLGRYRTNQLISLSEFPVIYALSHFWPLLK